MNTKFDQIVQKKLNNVLILGLTFKEECNDYRNSLIFSIIKKLNQKKIFSDVFDPYLVKDINKIKIEKKVNIKSKIPNKKYDAVLIAVSHNYFKKISLQKMKKLSKYEFIFDLKNIYKNKASLTF